MNEKDEVKAALAAHQENRPQDAFRHALNALAILAGVNPEPKKANGDKAKGAK